MMDKSLFLLTVHYSLHEHPEWLAETQLTIQKALELKIGKEQSDKTALAYALSVYINNDPKTTKKFWNQVVKGIKVLYSVFEGSEFGKKIKEILEENNSEIEKE